MLKNLPLWEATDSQSGSQNTSHNGSQNKKALEPERGNKLDDDKSSSPPTPSSEPPRLKASAEESTPLSPPEIDRLVAATAQSYRLTPEIARGVVLLGVLRNQGKQRIRSPEYFRPIVEELLKQPFPRFYAEYLEHKLEELRGLVAARAP